MLIYFSIDFKFNILNFGVFDQNLEYYYLIFKLLLLSPLT
jgi:hypothetical protein